MNVADDAIDAAGKAFFSKIFEIAPGAIELFASFKDVPEEKRYESPGFVRHARSVMTTVGVAVQGLRDLDALVPVLENLGARHLGYGVQEAHYDVVGEALLKTLESALGDEWTPAVREAWKRANRKLGQGRSERCGPDSTIDKYELIVKIGGRRAPREPAPMPAG